MTKKEIQHTLLGILLLAALSESTWLYEMKVRFDWVSLIWLKKDLYSAWFVCMCAATAYLLPFLVKYRRIDSKVILTWLTFICLNISAYYMGDAVLKNLFSPVIEFLTFTDSLKFRLLGVFAVCLFAFGYHFITYHLIMEVRKQQAVLFFASAFLMFLLGNLTVLVIVGFGKGDSLADAVKMGYPQFWICLLLGVSGILTNLYFVDETE